MYISIKYTGSNYFSYTNIEKELGCTQVGNNLERYTYTLVTKKDRALSSQNLKKKVEKGWRVGGRKRFWDFVFTFTRLGGKMAEKKEEGQESEGSEKRNEHKNSEYCHKR